MMAVVVVVVVAAVVVVVVDPFPSNVARLVKFRIDLGQPPASPNVQTVCYYQPLVLSPLVDGLPGLALEGRM